MVACPCSEQHPLRTIGLQLCSPGTAGGYTLFAPVAYTTTYLIDIFGRRVNSWPSSHQPAFSSDLLSTGQLLRPAGFGNLDFVAPGSGGLIQIFEWDGTLTWSYQYSNSQQCQHHDVEGLPNGNVLLIAWEKRTQDQAIQAGRIPANVRAQGLWPDSIAEIEPTGLDSGDVVWLWRSWDHLVQDHDPTKDNYVVDTADHPGRLDINYPPGTSQIDWLHFNGIDYDPALDQIVVSSRALDEVDGLGRSVSLVDQIR